jgi:hypothetical protein
VLGLWNSDYLSTRYSHNNYSPWIQVRILRKLISSMIWKLSSLRNRRSERAYHRRKRRQEDRVQPCCFAKCHGQLLETEAPNQFERDSACSRTISRERRHQDLSIRVATRSDPKRDCRKACATKIPTSCSMSWGSMLAQRSGHGSRLQEHPRRIWETGLKRRRHSRLLSTLRFSSHVSRHLMLRIVLGMHQQYQ